MLTRAAIRLSVPTRRRRRPRSLARSVASLSPLLNEQFIVMRTAVRQAGWQDGRPTIEAVSATATAAGDDMMRRTPEEARFSLHMYPQKRHIMAES